MAPSTISKIAVIILSICSEKENSFRVASAFLNPSFPNTKATPSFIRSNGQAINVSKADFNPASIPPSTPPSS